MSAEPNWNTDFRTADELLSDFQVPDPISRLRILLKHLELARHFRLQALISSRLPDGHPQAGHRVPDGAFFRAFRLLPLSL